MRISEVGQLQVWLAMLPRAHVLSIFPLHGSALCGHRMAAVVPPGLHVLVYECPQAERQHPFIVLLSLKKMYNHFLVYAGCCNQIPTLGGLETARRYSLQFWRLACPVSWHPKILCLVRVFWFIGGCLFTVSSFG